MVCNKDNCSLKEEIRGGTQLKCSINYDRKVCEAFDFFMCVCMCIFVFLLLSNTENVVWMLSLGVQCSQRQRVGGALAHTQSHTYIQLVVSLSVLDAAVASAAGCTWSEVCLVGERDWSECLWCIFTFWICMSVRIGAGGCLFYKNGVSGPLAHIQLTVVCACTCQQDWNSRNDLTSGIQEHVLDFDSGCVYMLKSEGLKGRNIDVMLQDDEMIAPV